LPLGARHDACCKRSRLGTIQRAIAGAGDLMQRSQRQPATGQPCVDLRQPERQAPAEGRSAASRRLIFSRKRSMPGDDPTLPGLKIISLMFSLCSLRSNKSQATNRPELAVFLSRKVKTARKCLANKTRSLDAGIRIFWKFSRDGSVVAYLSKLNPEQRPDEPWFARLNSTSGRDGNFIVGRHTAWRTHHWREGHPPFRQVSNPRILQLE
jgi:hypothetical protein